MKQTAHIVIAAVAVAGLVCSLGGCTVKATTNSTTDGVNNFLSSTTAKSWVTEDGLVKKEEKVEAFVAINFENLKQDMARGQGEYLTSLGTLLEIPTGHRQKFYLLARAKYPLLISSERTTPDAMLAGLFREMSANKTLHMVALNR